MGPHVFGMERQDTSISVPRPVFNQLRKEKPPETSWGAFLSKAVGIEDHDSLNDPLSGNELEEIVANVAHKVEEEGYASASDFEEAVFEALREDRR